MDPYKQVVLAARPKGLPRVGDFRLETRPMPEPLDGEVLVATKFLSLDPYMRGRMNDAGSYAPPVNVGGVMEGEVVAEVVRSRHPSLSRGDLVRGRIGWRTHAAIAPRDLQRVETGPNPPETSLGALGMPDPDHPARVSGSRRRDARSRIGAPRPRRESMTKLKLGPLTDDKPVKVSVELRAVVHRDLIAYAEVLGRTTGQSPPEPAKLIPPMVERFMATDRAFAKACRDRIAQVGPNSAERSR